MGSMADMNIADMLMIGNISEPGAMLKFNIQNSLTINLSMGRLQSE